MLNSQKRNSLEKAIKRNAVTEEQRTLGHYIQLRIKQSFEKLLRAQDIEDIYRYQGEVQCLTDLFKVVSNGPVDLFEETNNGE